jgi:hyperosmotically inducible periplasmic protein
MFLSNLCGSYKMKFQINTLPTISATTLVIALAFGVINSQAATLDAGTVKDSQTPMAAEFKKLDSDTNELLTKSEAKNDKLFTSSNFAKADIDKDGSLNQSEYANFKSGAQKKVVKRVASDSLITSTAKANLLTEKGLKSFKISVETYKGEVILSGFVDTEAAKTQAEEVVSKIDGVKSVKNSLEVKV